MITELLTPLPSSATFLASTESMTGSFMRMPSMPCAPLKVAAAGRTVGFSSSGTAEASSLSSARLSFM